MKTYFIRWGDFANTYELAWADNKDDVSWLVSQNFARCTRRQAEYCAQLERDCRKYDPAFSGFASSAIYPAKFYQVPVEDADTWLYRNCELKGLIFE